MSWVQCPKCLGEQPARDNCSECHGNGGAFAIPPDRPIPPPPPVPDRPVRRG